MDCDFLYLEDVVSHCHYEAERKYRAIKVSNLVEMLLSVPLPKILKIKMIDI